MLEKKQQIALTKLCQTTPTETGLREIHFYVAQDSLCASSSTGEIWELRFQREKIAPIEMSTNIYKYKSKKNTLNKSCSKQWSSSFNTQFAMTEWFHFKNGQLQRTLTTDDFSHSVTPGIICKVLDLGCYVIYLNKDRNRICFFDFVFKKGLDISLRLGLPSEEGQNSCNQSPIPPHSSRTSGKSGNLPWAVNNYKEVCSTHLIHWDYSEQGLGTWRNLNLTEFCCWEVNKSSTANAVLGGQSQPESSCQWCVGEHTEQEPSSVPFLCFPWSAAGRGGLLCVGEQQQGLQDSLKILHNFDKLENCSASNRIQVSSERHAQAGLNEQTGRQVLQKKAVC